MNDYIPHYNTLERGFNMVEEKKLNDILAEVREVEDVIDKLFLSNSMMHFVIDELIRIDEMSVGTIREREAVSFEFERSKTELKELVIHSNYIVNCSRKELSKILETTIELSRGDDDGITNA